MTAAKPLMDNDFRPFSYRGEALHLPKVEESTNLDFDPEVMVSAHPSAVLRGPQRIPGATLNIRDGGHFMAHLYYREIFESLRG